MEILLLIGLIVVVLLVGFQIYKTRKILKIVRTSNAIVYGGRGKGKDLFFQRLINSTPKKKKVFGNMSYGRNEVVNPAALTVTPNTYKSFISGEYSIINKDDRFENSTYYLSDSGVFFPNFYDNELKKLYPSMPAYFALSRHLYNQNIVINIQDIDRCWKLLEEQQQDCFVRMRGIFKLPFNLGIFCFGTFYDNVNSAKSNRIPLKARGLSNDYNRANIESVKAEFGSIINFTFFLPIRKIKYDTRYFHRVIFGCPAPSKKNNKRRKLKNEKNKK